MRRVILAAALLLGALPAHAPRADMLLLGAGGPRGGIDPTRWMMVSGRLRIDSTAVNAGSAGLNMLSRAALVTPKWACGHPRLLFVNWWGRETITPPEVDGANAITIDGASIENAGGPTFTSMTFAGSASVTIAAGGFAISDDPGAVTLSANTGGGTYYARTSVTVANSTQSFPGFLNLNNTISGEHASLADSPGAQTWSLTSGTPGGTQTRAYGPAALLCNGWDGSPVVYLAGDSICYGKGDITVAARGVFGYLPRGLDDSASGSLAYTDWCIAGQSAASSSEGAATDGHYGRRIEAINGIAALNHGSAPPFTTLVVEHGTNDGANQATDVPAFWAMMRGQFPAARIVQATLTPHTNDSVAGDSSCLAANSDRCWTDTAHQASSGTPYNAGGVVSTFNTSLVGGSYTGCGTSCVDGVIDITPQAWTSLSLCQAGTQADCTWHVPAFTTTLAATAASGSNSFSMNAAPAVGDNLVFEPGTASVDAYKSGGLDGGGYVVAGVTGSGPFTVTLTGSSGNSQLTHNSGAAIAEAYSNSDLHPNVMGHAAIAQGVIAAKSNGTIR